MRYIGFDTETTGIDPFNDRIVQAVISLYDEDGSTLIKEREWFINPGIKIPQEASEVHGFSNEFLKERGEEPENAIVNISDTLVEWYEEHPYDTVLSIYNASFDSTILNSELKRIGRSTLSWGSFLIGDALVIDKALDKYRKGSRKLVCTAKHYGVEFDESKAHDAGFDNFLSVAVLSRILKKHPIMPTPEGRESFMEFQRVNKREQARSLQEYFRRKDPSAVVNGEWPEMMGQISTSRRDHRLA